jgi:hypothetical protein
MAKKKSIVLDFDGVLHSYTSKFRFPWIIPDPPVDGAMQFLQEAVKTLTVRIFSTRSSNERGLKAMQDWILRWGVEQCGEDFKATFKKLKFPNGGKPQGHLYIDDRGLQFNGTFPSIEYIENFKPWNK